MIMRSIRIEGDLAYIPLTKGYEAIIDAANVHLVDGFNWTASVKFRTDGTLRSVYAYRKPRVDGKQLMIQLHRVILDAPADLEVDHIDCNGLNNTRANLRLATKSQNQCNRRYVKNSSGVKGVRWHKTTSKWEAVIRANGRDHRLGEFSDIGSAAACVAAARVQMHGEFGRQA